MPFTSRENLLLFVGKERVNTVAPRGASYLVSWCFEPSQPQRIIPGLRETFIRRYMVERTNKAEIRREEESEKAESYRENLWNEIQLKGP